MQIRFIRMIDELFGGVPQTRKTLELKEEMVQNLMEKYNDLRAEGRDEEAAFSIAAASVGDISDLLEELGQPRQARPAHTPGEEDYAGGEDVDGYDPETEGYDREQDRKNKASTVATAVMLYILSPTPVIILGNGLGLVLLFAMIAIATGLLIYNGMSGGKRNAATQAGASPPDGEWEARRKRKKRAMRSLSGAFWMIVVALYFLISFGTEAWHITWILFLIAVAVQNILKALVDLKGK